MCKIQKIKEFSISNVLTIRKKATQEEIKMEMKKVREIVSQLGVSLDGPLVSTTYGTAVIDGIKYADTELFIPLSEEVTPPEGYSFRENLTIKNVVNIKHQGSQKNLDQTFIKLKEYLVGNKLQPITPVYSVSRNTQDTILEEEVVIDFYVGVNG